MHSTTTKYSQPDPIETLAGGIAHDFNNLLAAIVGNITLVKMKLSPDNEMYRRLADAEEASMRAKDLTHRLLAFAERGKPRKSPVPVTEMINEAVGAALENSAVTCSVSTDEDVWMVEADRGQIVRVLCSLLVNARESMPRGGEITIDVGNFHCAAADRLLMKPGSYIRIRIRDEGSGIPPENLGRVFEPYFTTKPWGSTKGVGLSLAICLSAVKAHGGLLTLESGPGLGTTAVVFLPARRAPRLRKMPVQKSMRRLAIWKNKARAVTP